ncbi:hypothetical protein HPB48_019637 [Haemaphysalis longicornis]|uniref:Uncharacterized protein n=1 Tax=Haemaphysalis longicornis TaxID=44386 RepID=A0A9J6GZN8_HAELO|nr:hypothetical protein HPB48_019637 [Haemaphysalis longicornis]
MRRACSFRKCIASSKNHGVDILKLVSGSPRHEPPQSCGVRRSPGKTWVHAGLLRRGVRAAKTHDEGASGRETSARAETKVEPTPGQVRAPWMLPHHHVAAVL